MSAKFKAMGKYLKGKKAVEAGHRGERGSMEPKDRRHFLDKLKMRGEAKKDRQTA